MEMRGSEKNPINNRCHEAIQIYTLVEVDSERQANEKTELFIGERLPMSRQVSSEEHYRHTNNSEDSLDFVESGQSSCGKWS